MQSVQDLKEITDVLQETALVIYRAKQKAMENEGDDEKKDIISILSEYFLFTAISANFLKRRYVKVRAKASAVEEDRLSDE